MLRANLIELLTAVGIVDVDVDSLVADEHHRSVVYQRVVTVMVESRARECDRAIVACILREPVGTVAKTAVVALVDGVAATITEPAEFRQWAAGVLAEVELRGADIDGGFLRSRVRDWTLYLAIRTGQLPTSLELCEATAWMQRRIAEESPTAPVLAILSECGSSRKIRNIARNRLGGRS